MAMMAMISLRSLAASVSACARVHCAERKASA
jgi:hypothetical protein